MKPIGWQVLLALAIAFVLPPPVVGQDAPEPKPPESHEDLLEREGGSTATERAVRLGLRWLAAHQDESGRWSSEDFWKHCKTAKCDGPGLREFDAGVTGLALLAFLGAGHNERDGAYAGTVRKGIGWLTRIQKHGEDLDGAIGYVEGTEDQPKPEWVYNHAIATMAICEALASTDSDALVEPAKKAIDLCLRAQNPEAGWRYGIRPKESDTSVTGWFVQALHAAEKAGFEFSDEAYAGVLTWLDEATSESGATGYIAPDGESSFIRIQQNRYDSVPCMTAAAILSRIFAGQRKSDEVIRDGGKILMEHLPSWPKHKTRPVNMYYWYYGTYAMFQVGGRDWKKWNKAMKKALLDRQVKRGHDKGSWHPVGEWGIAGGRVYSTAIGVLTLEAYYRQNRIE